MWKLFIVVSIILKTANINCEELDINYMRRGQLYAQTSIEDKNAPGGFANSSNKAKKIVNSSIFKKNGFFLKLDTNQFLNKSQNTSYNKLYIVNKTKSNVTLDASDSRLDVIAEAYYKGKWRPIEYLQSSWCGNSYHKVYLKQNEYWEFVVPKFKGKIKTKIRYKILLDNKMFITSNEIYASVNKGQFVNKEGHTPNNLMDSYND